MCVSLHDLYESLDDCIVPGWKTKSGEVELTWTGENTARKIQEILDIYNRKKDAAQ